MTRKRSLGTENQTLLYGIYQELNQALTYKVNLEHVIYHHHSCFVFLQIGSWKQNTEFQLLFTHIDGVILLIFGAQLRQAVVIVMSVGVFFNMRTLIFTQLYEVGEIPHKTG